ncbi:MAG TPA: SRPBCC family protein [Alphaproteobacteria bacterium]|nr:SRPBCC family protein [Alphaproteobacteria bacterium]
MASKARAKAKASSRFDYVIYIRATPQKVWQALTEKKFTEAYWCGTHHETSWKKGAAWKLVFEGGQVADKGTVVEAKKAKRLVLKWQHQLMPALRKEGYSRCTIALSSDKDVVKLSVAHEMARANSKFIAAVATGWPAILSSLKSLLETGKVLTIRMG